MTQLAKSKTTPAHKWQFDAIGTRWTIETVQPLDTTVKQMVLDRIARFDKTYSRFRDDSLASALMQPGTHIFPDDFSPLFSLYRSLYKLTDGRMTPFIGSVLEQAGYDKAYSFTKRTLQLPATVSDISWDGDRTITTTKPIVLDVGAAGKGYAVDIVYELLKDFGYESFVIDAGGDIRTLNMQQQIGLEHPHDATKIIGVATISNQSICASATNRRAWKDTHHIYDAKTVQPVHDVIATWVIAETALHADAIATALFFVSPRTLEDAFSFEYVRANSRNQLDYSPGFKGKLFHENAAK